MGIVNSTGIAQVEVKVLYQQNTVQDPVFPTLKELAWMEERESFINHVFMASEGLEKITAIAQKLPLDSLKTNAYSHSRSKDHRRLINCMMSYSGHAVRLLGMVFDGRPHDGVSIGVQKKCRVGAR